MVLQSLLSNISSANMHLNSCYYPGEPTVFSCKTYSFTPATWRQTEGNGRDTASLSSPGKAKQKPWDWKQEVGRVPGPPPNSSLSHRRKRACNPIGVGSGNSRKPQNIILGPICISLVVVNSKGDECDTMEASRGPRRHPPLCGSY